ncbi:hypothetical protein FDP22_00470 [Paroceanicella profunda]|uniref:Uncharacterized protein n=1 Tax=Paroceanicella profunda TaxID=2579971 RepID=A0A5B8FVA2_9RHOB|nr:hypothetical protein [Paroceanicella profunda]QDL90399.1 hypothetical protein FDP22_00470 [Paroceanicella profunda]
MSAADDETPCPDPVPDLAARVEDLRQALEASDTPPGILDLANRLRAALEAHAAGRAAKPSAEE